VTEEKDFKEDMQALEHAFKEKIDAFVEQSDQIQKGDKEKYKTMFYQTAIQGEPLQEAFGFSQELMEALYSQAYQLYNNGQYALANQAFRSLIALNQYDTRYHLGLAASYHMLKDFDNAITVYVGWAVLDHDNPLPYYHAADCCLQMKNEIGALLLLNLAIERCSDEKPLEKLKNRAISMRDELDKNIKKEAKKDASKK